MKKVLIPLISGLLLSSAFAATALADADHSVEFLARNTVHVDKEDISPLRLRDNNNMVTMEVYTTESDGPCYTEELSEGEYSKKIDSPDDSKCIGENLKIVFSLKDAYVADDFKDHGVIEYDTTGDVWPDVHADLLNVSVDKQPKRDGTLGTLKVNGADGLVR